MRSETADLFRRKYNHIATAMAEEINIVRKKQIYQERECRNVFSFCTFRKGEKHMNDNSYISRQISVYKTDKKLVELIDKLNPAPLTLYAHIHAHGDDGDDNRRVYSNIGIILQDYSQGTGQNTRRATANLLPSEVAYIFNQVRLGILQFEFRTDKIFGIPDANGRAQVTKLTIKRANVGSDRKPRRYPWYIEIENGTGIPQKTQIGGTYCQANSFVSGTKVYANLSDLDFFKLFCDADKYITAWELAHAPGLLRNARKAIEANARNNQQ